MLEISETERVFSFPEVEQDHDERPSIWVASDS